MPSTFFAKIEGTTTPDLGLLDRLSRELKRTHKGIIDPLSIFNSGNQIENDRMADSVYTMLEQQIQRHTQAALANVAAGLQALPSDHKMKKDGLGFIIRSFLNSDKNDLTMILQQYLNQPALQSSITHLFSLRQTLQTLNAPQYYEHFPPAQAQLLQQNVNHCVLAELDIQVLNEADKIARLNSGISEKFAEVKADNPLKEQKETINAFKDEWLWTQDLRNAAADRACAAKNTNYVLGGVAAVATAMCGVAAGLALLTPAAPIAVAAVWAISTAICAYTAISSFNDGLNAADREDHQREVLARNYNTLGPSSAA